MCWSLPVSVTFAVLEALSLSFLVWRIYFKKDASVVETQQRYVFPLLFSIFCIETLEAFTWAESTGMRPISESENGTCTARNKHLTRAAAIVLFCQPFASVWATRHTGNERNKELLVVPQHLALLTTVSMIGSLIVGETLKKHLLDISTSHFIGFHGLHTCSWIGVNGHIHWVWKFPAAYFAPNAFAYFLFGIASTFARPLHIASGPIALYLVLFGAILFGFHLSMEAASVWCWSAIGLHIYFIAQPYLIEQYRQYELRKKPDPTVSPPRVTWTPAAPQVGPAP